MVGTPGRLDELTKSGNLLLTHCRFLVLDEADGLLQQGHGDLINRLHAKAPKTTADSKRLQMIVCSATLHSVDVKRMAVSIVHSFVTTSGIGIKFSLSSIPFGYNNNNVRLHTTVTI